MDYFQKYQSSQAHLNAIINSLYHGQDELRQDNASIEQEKANLWAIMGRLRQYAYLAQHLDTALSAQIADIETTDPDRAKVLKEDLLFPVRQKVQDLLTQLAVSVQGYLALDLIRRNNVELIKGVDRATTTTVSALRTAVIVAQALSDQKLVLDQITALNTTTGNLIESTSTMLRQQSGADRRAGGVGDDRHRQAPGGVLEHLRDDGRDRHVQAEGARQPLEDDRRRSRRRSTSRRRTSTACAPRNSSTIDGRSDAGGVRHRGDTVTIRCARSSRRSHGPPRGLGLVARVQRRRTGHVQHAHRPRRVRVEGPGADVPGHPERHGRQAGADLHRHARGRGEDRRGRPLGRRWFSEREATCRCSRPRASGSSRPEKIMLSPVVIGVKQSVAQKFGWANNPDVTWKDIQAKAADGSFQFAMTNPAASNSGLSALIGVASALSGTSDAIDTGQIDKDALRGFFKGQTVTAGSSGFLADTYVRQQDAVDGIINYESVLMGLNGGGQLREPLTIIYPKEGIITADYPFMLLNAAKRAAYDKVVAYLRDPKTQQRIMSDTLRRPAVPGVALDPRFPSALLVELPYPVQPRHDRRADLRLPRRSPAAGDRDLRARHVGLHAGRPDQRR